MTRKVTVRMVLEQLWRDAKHDDSDYPNWKPDRLEKAENAIKRIMETK